MPPGRTLHARAVSNENDENSRSTRMTRAKAAALGADELALPSKGVQTKMTTNSQAQGVQRKRAALGDVSNVTKADAMDGKKPASRAGLVSKAAQPAGIRKSTRTSGRAPAAAKNSRITSEVRRNAGKSVSSSGPKRKVSNTATNPSLTDITVEGEKEPLRKKIHTDERLASTEDNDVSAPKAEPGASRVEATSTSVFPPGVTDPDPEDLDDPLMVAEYTHEIFEYLRDLEVKTIPNPNYMDHQDELEWKMRGILIDWLIEVHTRFHLLPETLFLAVNIIDRFLSQKVVQLDRLQLVGITAMFIASKYEEVLSPHVANFSHVADDGFSEAEILAAERFILSTLNYDLSYPNPMNFLRRISKADNYDIQSRTIGKYLMEISLLDHRFMAYRPSHIAAGAMYLSRLILDRGEWDDIIAFYAGYTEDEIEPIVQLMVDYLARPTIHDAFFKKYERKKFLKASMIAQGWARVNARHFDIVDVKLSLDHIS